MKIITEGKINISHVMWQPINACTKNCKGCYANQSPQDKGYGGSELLYLVYSDQPKIIANQFTISLDTIKTIPSELYNSLNKLWSEVYLLRKGDPEKNFLPELCLTTRDFSTLDFWCKNLEMTAEDFLNPVSVISFSDDLEKGMESLNGCDVHYNRNLLVKDQLSKPYDFNRIFDSVYVTLFKYPLGTTSTKEEGVNHLRNWSEVILRADESRCKVIPDACVVDAFKWKFEQKACTAGIDKVHVWAKGACTGCPYDAKRIIHWMDSRKVDPDLYTEFEKACYPKLHLPIKQCPIVDSLDRLYKQDEKLVKEVINRLGLKY